MLCVQRQQHSPNHTTPNSTWNSRDWCLAHTCRKAALQAKTDSFPFFVFLRLHHPLCWEVSKVGPTRSSNPTCSGAQTNSRTNPSDPHVLGGVHPPLNHAALSPLVTPYASGAWAIGTCSHIPNQFYMLAHTSLTGHFMICCAAAVVLDGIVCIIFS